MLASQNKHLLQTAPHSCVILYHYWKCKSLYLHSLRLQINLRWSQEYSWINQKLWSDISVILTTKYDYQKWMGKSVLNTVIPRFLQPTKNILERSASPLLLWNFLWDCVVRLCHALMTQNHNSFQTTERWKVNMSLNCLQCVVSCNHTKCRQSLILTLRLKNVQCSHQVESTIVI